MDLRPPLPDLGKIAQQIAARRLNALRVPQKVSTSKHPSILDLDTLGTSPEWNADDLAPSHSEAAK